MDSVARSGYGSTDGYSAQAHPLPLARAHAYNYVLLSQICTPRTPSIHLHARGKLTGKQPGPARGAQYQYQRRRPGPPGDQTEGH